jgi:hypothetical protein
MFAVQRIRPHCFLAGAILVGCAEESSPEPSADPVSVVSSSTLPTEAIEFFATAESDVREGKENLTVRLVATVSKSATAGAIRAIRMDDDRLRVDEPGGPSVEMSQTLVPASEIFDDRSGDATLVPVYTASIAWIRNPVLSFTRSCEHARPECGAGRRYIAAHAVLPAFSPLQDETLKGRVGVTVDLWGEWFRDAPYWNESGGGPGVASRGLPSATLSVASEDGCASLPPEENPIDRYISGALGGVFRGRITSRAPLTFNGNASCTARLQIEGKISVPFWRGSERITSGGAELHLRREVRVGVTP